MRTSIAVFLGLVGVAGMSLTLAGAASAEAQGLQSLRGAVPLEETGPPPQVPESAADAGRIGRTFPQQPPLIPHAIDDFNVDLKANQCLMCHDRPAAKQMGAPAIGESHYVGRTGEAGQSIARGRWFCTQCHVPQAKAEPLVPNRFDATAGR